MTTNATEARKKVVPYGFIPFPEVEEEFSTDEDDALTPEPDAPVNGANRIAEHELVYPPKAFDGEDLDHDWLAMMLDEQHEVHIKATDKLKTARGSSHAAAAELMKLKQELKEERGDFRKLMKTLEAIIGPAELASVYRLMRHGMEHGVIPDDESDDTRAENDGEEGAGEGEAQSPDNESDEPRKEAERNAPKVPAASDPASAPRDSFLLAPVFSLPQAHHIPQPNPSGTRAKVTPARSARPINGAANGAHSSSSPGSLPVATTTPPGSPPGTLASLRALPPSQEEREASPDALSYTSKSDYGEQREEPEEAPDLLSPLRFSDSEQNASASRVLMSSSSAGSPQRPGLRVPAAPSSPSKTSPARARSPLPPSSPPSSPTTKRVEQVTVMMDVEETTTETTTKVPAVPSSPPPPPPADAPKTPPPAQPRSRKVKTPKSVEFISANFDTSLYAGPIETRKRRRSNAVEPEPLGYKRVKKDINVNGAPSTTPEKAGTFKRPVTPPPAVVPATQADTALAPAPAQDAAPTLSASIIGSVMGVIESSKRIFRYNTRSNTRR